MPYKLVEDDGKYCLEKEDTGERVDGSCHDDRAETEKMMRAMYASEKPKKSLRQRIDMRLKELGLLPTPVEQTGFKVVGNHWYTVNSNNFKDRDDELFTEKAIDDYVARVDAGIVSAPELHVWHAGKSTAIGQAAWVGRHGHFVMAAGEFYGAPQAQAAKAWYTKHAKDTGISHGFTYPADQFDGKAYHQFNTFEISLLPRGAEANFYTSLEGVKAMPLDDKKVKYLKEVFGEEHAARILEDWDKRGKALEELGIEYKDFSVNDAEVTAQAQAEATDNATEALGDLMAELANGSAEAIKAALAAVKAAKATDARVDAAKTAQDAALVQMRKDIDDLRSEMDLRPRSASKAGETEVEASHLSAEMQKTLREQNTVKDSFFGTEVPVTP